MFLIPSNATFSNVSNYSVSFKSSDKMAEAKDNFKRFLADAKAYVKENYYNVLAKRAEELRRDLETSEEFISAKESYLQQKTEMNVVHNERQLIPRTVDDPRKGVIYRKQEELREQILSNALDPAQNNSAAKIFSALTSYGYTSSDSIKTRIDELESHNTFLIVDYSNKKVYIHPYLPPELKQAAEAQFLNTIKQEAQNGDIAAKLILWSRESSSSLDHYRLNEVISKIDDQVKFFNSSSRKIELNGKKITIQEAQNVQVQQNLEKYDAALKNSLQELNNTHSVKNMLANGGKEKVLELINDIDREVEALKGTPLMEKAQNLYEENLQKERERIRQVRASNPELEARISFEQGESLSPKNTILNNLLKYKIELLQEELQPKQLLAWSDATWPADEVSPKKLVLENPNNTFDEFATTRGFGGIVSTNKMGDLVLEFPSYTNQMFKDIKFIKKNGNEEYFRITELKDNGTEETYTLVTGSQNNEGKSCAKIICDSGSETCMEYGKPVVIGSVVRKPVIAFRDFADDTDIIISVDFSGDYKVIYPKAIQKDSNKLTWSGKVYNNNEISINDNFYSYIFWDGLLPSYIKFNFSEGNCVSSVDTIEFLEQKCSEYGLDSALKTDFITFWAPYLMENDYNLIRFLSKDECKEVANLEITSNNCEKINIVRFYMIFKGLDTPISIKPPAKVCIEFLDGPKIFDWGGFQIYS